MDLVQKLITWLESFFIGGSTLVTWLISPINVVGFNMYVSPLELVSISGLTTFVLLAIGKWLLN